MLGIQLDLKLGSFLEHPMPHTRSILLLVLLTLSCTWVQAFPLEYFIVHKLYLEEPGETDYAFSLVRDRQGYLWIGTDNGLQRYDGYQLKRFITDRTNPRSLGTRSVPVLQAHSSGTLWVGGTSLSRYQPESETFTNFDITGGAEIRSLYQDSNGVVWVGGDGFGLRGFDPAQNKLIHQFFNKPESRNITALCPHQQLPALWVGTSHGLSLFNTETFAIDNFELPAVEHQGIENIRDIVQAQDGKVWVATLNGLFVINPASREVRHYQAQQGKPGALQSNTLWSVFEDSHGRMWVGTDKQGVQVFRPESDDFMHLPASLTNDHAFPPGAVQDIFEDSHGNLWFAVSNFGVRRISPELQKFIPFTYTDNSRSSLSFNNVMGLLEDKGGDIWIATDGGGLNRYKPGSNTFDYYRHKPKDSQSLGSDSVLSLAEDQQDNIWIGTWGGGLNKYNVNSGKFTRFPHSSGAGLAGSNIYKVLVGDKGEILMCLWRKGLQIYDPASDTYRSYFPGGEGRSSGISNDSIYDIKSLGEGRYWIGGSKGLELFNARTEKFSRVAIPGIASVIAIQWESANLWLGTSNGLLKYQLENGTTRRFTRENGLPDNYVTSLEFDDLGNLWVGTRSGLGRFHLKSETFESFTEKDGLAGDKFNRQSHLKTRTGMMYFGGIDGLNQFDPNRLPKNHFAPKVQLTAISLNQKPVDESSSPYLHRHISQIDKLELPYDMRDVTFEFTSLNFISPEKNRYRYRLVGLEKSWNEVSSNRRRARYNNLEPGKYYFQVVASNNDGVWSNKARGVDLTIFAPWWQTWWARGIVLACLAATMYLFSLWRLRINRMRQDELKALIREKTQELEDASQSVQMLNAELEQRVERRTSELSIEIEERRLAEAKLFHMAFHDPLTGLPNRPWLLQHLEQLIEIASIEKSRFALFFMDGDRFKKVNDTHGHLLGDMLLVAAAKRLAELMPSGYHAVRLGGDEFTVLIDNVTKEQELTAFAQRIVAAFDAPFSVEQSKMYFRMSIGMVICDQQYTKPEQVLRDADIAMYRAKEIGRGNYQFFDEKMREQTVELAALEGELQHALALDQFKIVFQPIVHLHDGSLAGFEVLLRWHHPTRGMVPPDKFIPVAEESGAIYDIGLWVLRQACLQLKHWSQMPGVQSLPSIAVNISPIQLSQKELIDNIDKILLETGIDSAKLKLEITETALMENTDNVNLLLEAFRKRDIELAIDDFGTGYSSLSYLDQLPVQVLKIDRKFVDGLVESGEDNGGAQEIVRATISLAHNLKIKVVAEGIENASQWETLKSYLCDFGQGYHIARPLAAEDATELVKSANKQPAELQRGSGG
ncbi:diguanylate cyclase (GGDEF)-like protein [Alteromonadaceae bacterium 2753L.S.0a.02]|nr:diguanylate cyclase (GGDEF)-like protein [Alteromonadaceae bacterium 2753L.S.0a.02]